MRARRRMQPAGVRFIGLSDWRQQMLKALPSTSSEGGQKKHPCQHQGRRGCSDGAKTFLQNEHTD